jgi:hypothetical protein
MNSPDTAPAVVRAAAPLVGAPTLPVAGPDATALGGVTFSEINVACIAGHTRCQLASLLADTSTIATAPLANNATRMWGFGVPAMLS